MPEPLVTFNVARPEVARRQRRRRRAATAIVAVVLINVPSPVRIYLRAHGVIEQPVQRAPVVVVWDDAAGEPRIGRF